MSKPPAQKFRSWELAWLVLIYGWIAYFSYPYLFQSATENVRQIQSYNLDSADALRAVEHAMHSRFLRLAFNDYGHFYSNLSIAAAELYSLFGQLSERGLFLILRFNALIGGCCAIAITYVFARRYLGAAAAVLASGIMAFSPALLEYSNQAKPDSWQTFFVMLSLYFLGRAWEEGRDYPPNARLPLPPARFGLVLASSAAAGAAFGTKYLGMFLLPLIGLAALGVSPVQVRQVHLERAIRIARWLAVPLALLFFGFAVLGNPARVAAHLILPNLPLLAPAINFLRLIGVVLGLAFLAVVANAVFRLRLPRFDGLLRYAYIFGVTFGAFVLAFFLTSPWLFYRLPFIREILIRDSLVGDFQPFGLKWLEELFESGTYVGHIPAAMAAAGMIWLIVALLRGDRQRPNLALAGVLGFIVIFLTLLVLKVNRATVLYGLPIIPPLALFAAYYAVQLVAAISARLSPRAAAISIAALLSVLLPDVWVGGTRLMARPNLVTTVSADNQQLSTWLVRCLPAGTKILAGSYSYVPADFPDVVMGDSYSYYERQYPAVVIVNLKTRADTEEAAKAGPAHKDPDRFQLYDLLAGPGWRAAAQFGEFQIYRRDILRLNQTC